MAIKSGGKRTVAEEYIISIVPELDKEKFNTEKGKVKELAKLTKGNQKDRYEEAKIAEKLQKIENLRTKGMKEALKVKKEQLKLDKEQYKHDKFFADVAKKAEFGDFLTSIGVMVAAFKVTYDIMQKMTESATEFSNSLITAGSAFVNRNTRNTMARFGVSGQTATGMQSVMGLMGITAEDFAMMTPAQMQLYSRLMKQWQEGMNSINKTDMDKFQKTMQSMQSEMASAKLELQIQFYKMLVDLAPVIEDFYKSIISLIKSLGTLMNSPLVKGILSALSGLITGVIRIVSALARVLSFDFSGAWDALTGNDVASNNTTNYYSISSTSTNTFAGDTSSMYAIATQTQQDEINSISATIHSTGGA